MQRFLIEIPHEEEVLACTKALWLLLRTGSHFMSHAELGCRDGEHKAWLIVEAADKQEARLIVPPPFRSQAKITGLNRFTLEELEALWVEHGGTVPEVEHLAAYA